MPANAKTSLAASALERELTITRIFDAPRELVFEAWTQPEHLKRWWGPNGFTTPACEVDLRVGGTWRIVMRFPDGVNEHVMEAVYREIAPPERLSFTNVALDKDGTRLLEGVTSILLEDAGGKTKLTLRTRMSGLVPYADRMLEGMEPGWSQTLDRLSAALAENVDAGREIVATRVFDAPRDLVFQMWIDPEHISNWWGPRGFTTTTHEMDVRVGGVWRHTMHGPDGRDYPNETHYVEIAKPERLVYDHISPPKFRSTITFAEQGGKTKVTARMVFESAALRDRIAKDHGAVEGLQQTLARLGEQLESMSNPIDPQFEISRVFDAPRELVWKAFTESDRLSHWWGPRGFTWVSATLDLRPGGVFHYCMRSPGGPQGSNEMWGKFVYREIDPPQRIAFVNSFSDADGNIVRAPFNPNWPLEVLNIVTFTEEAGRTTVSVRGGPINATDEERNAFRSASKMMEQGFGGTFDQLDAYVAQQKSRLIVSVRGEREVIMTRVFDAPRQLVFEAWTKPEHLMRWYGRHGWTLPVCEVDLRIGGAWRYILSGPSGRKMGMRGVYREIVPPERLVMTESFDDFPGESVNTLTFAEHAGQTTLTINVVAPSGEIRDAILKSGMEAGAGETMDKLADLLALLQTGGRS